MLLDFFVGRIGVPVQAKAVVGTVRAIVAPAIPFPGIVWENGRRTGDSEHKGNGEAWRSPFWLQIPCPKAQDSGRRSEIRGRGNGKDWKTRSLNADSRGRKF